MAKRGPEQHDQKALKLRGSRLAKRRERKAAPPVEFKRPRARPIRDLDKIILKIPAYDPHAQAGDCVFDPKTAKKAIRFFEQELRHVKGAKARTPFLLERWQQAIIANLFGWKRPDGTRRYRQTFIFVPRKNGKTPMAAGIVLYALLEDGEPGAEVYGAASEYKQASLVFEHAAGMVRQNPDLIERCKLYTGQAKAIQVNEDFSTYRVISKEASSAHGFNTHAYVVDEVHALDDGELIETLETSTGARRQPLGVYITTSDYEREGSPCNAKYDYACKVRDGVIDDPSYLPVIFEADKDDDWTDPAVWGKSNPNLGVSVSREYLEAACKKAQATPAFENTFKRLHLNIRTEQDVRWLAMPAWDACAGKPLDLADYRGRKCWCGLDLASTRDLTALVMVFPEGNDVYTLIPWFWIPENTAREREKRDRVPYAQWIREGWIRTAGDKSVDYAAIRRDVNRLVDDHGISIQEIAADRLFQGEQLVHELSQDGFCAFAFGQGFVSMAGPTKRFEELVAQGNIRHGGNPVLRWHASNVAVEIDAAGNMKPSRRKSTEKIDGIVAAIMAIGRTVIREERQSVYQTRGLQFI